MAEFKLQVVPVTAFQQNCSIAWSDVAKRATVIDPGGDLDAIRAAITAAGVTVERILLTHGHIDHAGGASEFAAELGVEIAGPHEGDLPLLDKLETQARAYGLTGTRNVTPDRLLKEGDTVEIGGVTFDVLHCPGHSPGSLVFFAPALRFAFMGDVLFQGSVGRTDLPGGSHEQLIESIRTKILPLGDDVTFLPGHGAASTVGEERRTNPFLR